MFLAIKYLILSCYFLPFRSFMRICIYGYEYIIVLCVCVCVFTNNGVNEVASSIHVVFACIYIYIYI